MWRRFFSASSFAGYGVILAAVAELIATNGTSPVAWSSVLAGVAAVAKKEAGER